MKISCPVCSKEKDIDYGRYICSSCNSKFEYNSDGKTRLIKSYKFDYWMLFYALTMPIVFIFFLFKELLSNNFDFIEFLPFGYILLLYPLILLLRQALINDDKFLIGLYFKFISGDLNKLDIGSIISFYIMFGTNIIGVIMIIINLVI